MIKGWEIRKWKVKEKKSDVYTNFVTVDFLVVYNLDLCFTQGTIVYEQTLPGSAYFDVNPSTGDITLVSSLRFDSRIQIVVSSAPFTSSARAHLEINKIVINIKRKKK